MGYSLHWEPHGVVRTLSGEIGFDEYMQSIAELQNDMRFDALRFIIEDFSAVESIHIDPTEIDMVIASVIGGAFSNPHIQVAAVARLQQVRELITLFAQGSPYVTRMFDDLVAARSWVAEGETSPVPLDIQLQTAVSFDSSPLVY
jgi:hypothetical protein